MTETAAEKEELLPDITSFIDKVETSQIPADLKEEIKSSLLRLNRSMKFGSFEVDYERITRYTDWILSLPWNKRSQDNLDLTKAREIMDKNHYGLNDIKERLIEYLATLKFQADKEGHEVVKTTRASVICFVGLPGSGKTSLGASIAESFGRSFIRIPMGGMSSSLQLRGVPKTQPEGEPGLIIKSLRRAGTKNPVILLDEIDSTAEGAESDLMGVLLEILDPEQNFAFTDYFIDYPFDLSEVFFICSANKLGNITSAVMDRLEVIFMPRYTDDDKIHIARDYIFPRELVNIGLDPKSVQFDEEVWKKVIKPFGYEVDIRNLDRTVNGILRKVTRRIIEGTPQPVKIDLTNLEQFLPHW